ncbi:WD repeat-containing protein 3-like isoform X2 [Varroa destructor]|uniref:Small-subunit processome Utp12 domain-containing protein n=1 Tax=Varroa destructor TaxID=109461 RepID=A0A7M7JW42_VARDE|nr:WD repeat-containing protein 3-like isoform X2 [Varroa destructor]
MGVTTQYLRFVAGPSFGAVSNADGHAIFIRIKSMKHRYVAVTVCEDVILWDLKTKQKLTVCKGDKSEAVRLCVLNGGLLAVGYADGTVKVFSFEDGSLRVALQGHRAGVTCMTLDPSGSKLVTGAKDGVIIVWDIVNESGLYRLRGHKGPITQVSFLSESVLVSSSKDSFIKFWDLDTQHCFYTLVGHRGEVWDFVVIDGKWLVSGTSAPELTVWRLSFVKADGSEGRNYEEVKKTRADGSFQLEKDDEDTRGGNELSDQRKNEDNEAGDTEIASPLRLARLGTILRQGKDKRSFVIACWGQDHQVEIFRMLTEDEVRKKHSKRLKKELKRKAEDDDVKVEKEISVRDLVRRLNVISCKGKVSTADILVEKSTSSLRALIGLKSNALDIMELYFEEKKEPAKVVDSLRHLGHRTDVRTLCFTSDNAGIISASGEQLKLWSAQSFQCIRSLDCEYALSCGLLRGDRHAVVATKTGKIQLFDLVTGELTETIDAHQGPCWSLCFTPDKKGLVTGGSDKVVKFWDVEINKEARKFTLKLIRCLEMPEEILCLKISPNAKLLAVSLADNTVKVFFMDSLKFFLSLYGHQYPVLCMDISDDSNLLISGSSDRNVKIWGLDFGDCHKSLFAHSDSVMGVQFLPKSHQFFSVGKDKIVKHWDADNFQRVLTLEGHQREVWALAVSPNGKHVVTASHDKSIRIWDKTEEPLVLEEQREIEREEEAEKELDTEEAVIPREGEEEVAMAGKKTLVTIKCAERLLEALDVFEKEAEKEAEAKKAGTKPAAPHVLLMIHRTTCRFRYILEEIKRITAAEMEETLIVLPFDQVLALLEILVDLIERGWDVELMARALFFLIRIHSGQLLVTASAVKIMDKAQRVVRSQMTQLVDLVSFNLQALSFVQREAEEHSEESFFADATARLKKKKKRADKVRDQTVIVSIP